MNNLNNSSNTSNTSNDSSNTDLKNRLPKNVIFEVLEQPTIPPKLMFKMIFPLLASIIYLGIKDKLSRFKKHTTK